jgi:hypothetical protein
VGGEGPIINLSFQKQERFTDFCCKEISCYEISLKTIPPLMNCNVKEVQNMEGCWDIVK